MQCGRCGLSAMGYCSCEPLSDRLLALALVPPITLPEGWSHRTELSRLVAAGKVRSFTYSPEQRTALLWDLTVSLRYVWEYGQGWPDETGTVMCSLWTAETTLDDVHRSWLLVRETTQDLSDGLPEDETMGTVCTIESDLTALLRYACDPSDWKALERSLAKTL